MKGGCDLQKNKVKWLWKGSVHTHGQRLTPVTRALSSAVYGAIGWNFRLDDGKASLSTEKNLASLGSCRVPLRGTTFAGACLKKCSKLQTYTMG